ncbi:hypothetical protein PAPH110629_00475 [Paenibacillus phoenicis]
MRQAVITEMKQLERAAALAGVALQALINPIVEVGAGWGTLALALAKANPNWRWII